MLSDTAPVLQASRWGWGGRGIQLYCGSLDAAEAVPRMGESGNHPEAQQTALGRNPRSYPRFSARTVRSVGDGDKGEFLECL